MGREEEIEGKELVGVREGGKEARREAGREGETRRDEGTACR